MDDICVQEYAGFLTARGGKKRAKAKPSQAKPSKTKPSKTKPSKTKPSKTKPTQAVEEDADVLAVLGDQRALDGTWATGYINRAVLVGTRIEPDSNASNKAKRPRYWTATQGVPNYLRFEHGSADVASTPSCAY